MVSVSCVIVNCCVAWHAGCRVVQYVRRAMSNSEKLELIIVTKNKVLGSVYLPHFAFVFFFLSVNNNKIVIVIVIFII